MFIFSISFNFALVISIVFLKKLFSWRRKKYIQQEELKITNKIPLAKLQFHFLSFSQYLQMFDASFQVHWKLYFEFWMNIKIHYSFNSKIIDSCASNFILFCCSTACKTSFQFNSRSWDENFTFQNVTMKLYLKFLMSISIILFSLVYTKAKH